MVRRTDRPLFEVVVSFETTRLGPQCLVNAYARLVPVRRQPVRKSAPGGGPLPPQAVAAARRRGGEQHV
jgi:hypothetical protein